MQRPLRERSRRNQALAAQILLSFEQTDRTYRSPRLWRDLRAWGVDGGRQTVARLMAVERHKAHLKRRRLPFDNGIRPENAIAVNLLDWNFEAQAPNQRWFTDFTYIGTEDG